MVFSWWGEEDENSNSTILRRWQFANAQFPMDSTLLHILISNNLLREKKKRSRINPHQSLRPRKHAQSKHKLWGKTWMPGLTISFWALFGTVLIYPHLTTITDAHSLKLRLHHYTAFQYRLQDGTKNTNNYHGHNQQPGSSSGQETNEIPQ